MAGRVTSKFYFSLHFTLRYSSVSGLRCLKWLVPRNDRCAKILEMMKSLYSKWGADHSGLRGGTSYLYSPVRTLFVLFGGVGRRMTKFPPALSIQEASSTRLPSQKVERMGTPVSLGKKISSNDRRVWVGECTRRFGVQKNVWMGLHGRASSYGD